MLQHYTLRDEASLKLFAERFAQSMQKGVVFLQGELGAGKTTFVRAFLQSLGIKGKIKSPTYTLIESYDGGIYPIHHFDLYRLQEPKEVYGLGLPEYLEDSLCLVEWPEKGLPHLPSADVIIQIDFAEPGRELTVTANSPLGENVLHKLSK